MTAPSATLSAEQALALPGRPGPTLVRIWSRLSKEAQGAFLEMLRAPRDFSAEWLAHVLTDEGEAISASTIKLYRRALAREGELV